MNIEAMPVGCALVIEDDPLVAASLCEAIEETGLLTLLVPVTDKAGALALIEHERLSAVAVVDITGRPDRALPQVDALREKNVPTNLVATDSRILLPHEYCTLPFLQKPFTVEQFAVVLRKVAGRHARATS